MPKVKEETKTEEIKKPLAAPEPDLKARLAALETAIQEVEKRIRKHERYHFGRFDP